MNRNYQMMVIILFASISRLLWQINSHSPFHELIFFSFVEHESSHVGARDLIQGRKVREKVGITVSDFFVI